MELYYNFFDPDSIKRYLKTKEIHAETFEFNKIGSGVLKIEDLIDSESNNHILKLPFSKSVNGN